jgi:tetratricopeptide (TPR) repeat protein
MQERLIHWIFNLSTQSKVLKGCFVVCFLFATVAPLFAEWQKDYEAAMDLIKKNQWQAAIPKLQAAINDKPDEGSNIKFYGMKFSDYFPHYYLGWAYFNMKNYQAALTEFQQSEKYGAIQRKADLAEKMENMKALSRAQLVPSNPPPITPPVEPPVTEVPKNQTPPEAKKQEPIAAPAEEEKKVEDKKVEEEKKVTDAARVPPETKEPAQPEQQPATTIPPVDVNAENARFVIKNGARKYFEGDYDGAIYFLNTALEANPRNAAAQFLLGCAYASKYLLSGSRDQEFLRYASFAFQKAKEINPSYRVKNRNIFSPAVLALFEKSS